ncbi:hypothetical protein [Pseudoduganella sp.]|uniref:hypothetical protein n=1 Tax=Pseudoduganella sp. TaxID=1880898 RepID=UPI0035B10E3F
MFEGLNHYAKKESKCSNCGVAVRRKMRLFDFLVPIYMLSAIAARRFFQVDTGSDIAVFLGIAVVLFAIQLKLVRYEIK